DRRVEVRFLEFIFAVETPSQLGAQSKAYLIAECVGIYTFQSGRIQYKRGDHTLQVSAGRGGSGMEGVHLWGEGVRTGQRVVAGIRLYGGKGVHMLIFQVSVRQTENTSKMSCRYNIRS